ncbi:hypothetical protein ACIQVL_07420 [Streptomyces sp. NPDC090499]|uniref:hypothetical protein n=1 Tax=Streptomyces sp. NPDC090499 TaxID=3365965 RepID=UPI0038083F84
MTEETAGRDWLMDGLTCGIPGMTRTEIRDGSLLLFVAALEVAVIMGGGLSAAWALGVAVVYLVFLSACARGLVRRRRPGAADGEG